MLEPIAATWPAWEQTLGRLHPAAVHFPIALLVVAGGLEFWRMITRQKSASPTAFVCLAIGAVASIIAAALGLLDQSFVDAESAAIHQWLGIATAAFSVIVLTLALWNRADKANPFYRAGVLLCALLVSATGYYGGELTYGQGYLTEILWPPATTQPADLP